MNQLLLTQPKTGEHTQLCPLRYQGCGLYLGGLCRQKDGDPQFWNCETFREIIRTMKRYNGDYDAKQ